MVQFYRNLGRTGDKAEALRQAKLSLIRQGRKPYYWAPFILVGKSR
jgi:CHAT domain-containing protein